MSEKGPNPAELRSIDTTLAKPASVAAGSPPMLQWIEISLLRVDPRYQRSLEKNNLRNITAIAEAFDWSKFSTVHVAPIEGGLFAIIDGQHRTHAAAACGFETVPCQVTHMTLVQQASAFAAINGIVTKVTPLQIFRAALAAGEPWAIEVREVCRAADCQAVSYAMSQQVKKAGQIHAISYMRDVIERRGSETVTRALTIIRKTDGVGDVLEYYALGIFKPLLEALASRPHVLERRNEAIDFLVRTDLWSLQEQADKFVQERRRNSQPSVSKKDLLESLIGDAIDKAMPRRMALPGRAA